MNNSINNGASVPVKQLQTTVDLLSGLVYAYQLKPSAQTAQTISDLLDCAKDELTAVNGRAK